jgi:SNF2 family DNA or RNA helicase
VARNNNQQRLVWALNPKTLKVKAKIQKLGKKGRWTKGRSVKLRDIEYQARAFLTDTDRKILFKLQSGNPKSGYRGWLKITHSSILEALKEHPHLYLQNGREIRLSSGEPCLQVTEQNDVLHITLEPAVSRSTNFALKQIIPYHHAIVIYGTEHMELQKTLRTGGLRISSIKVEQIQTILARASKLGLKIESSFPSGGELEERTMPSKLVVRLYPKGGGLKLEVWSLIDDLTSHHPPGKGPRYLVTTTDGKTVQIERLLNREKALYKKLQDLVPQLKRYKALLRHPSACMRVLERLRDLPEESFVVEWPHGKTFEKNTEIRWSDLQVSVVGTNDWFTVQAELHLEGAEHLQLAQLLELQRQQGSRFIKLDEDRYFTLSQDLSKRLRALESASNQMKDGSYEIRALAASVLAESLNLESEDELWTLHRERLERAQNLKPQVPTGLQATLRPYQRQGFDWLARSAAWGVGVCLADDMGLGKTVQILSLLLSRSEQGPTLVVAPTSVCSNWRDETKKFTPSLEVKILQDVDRERTIKSMKAGEILITSYGLMCTNLDALKRVSWNTLVLDESQAIKNSRTQRFKAAVSLRADFRIAATGTPVENHMGELWSVFRFLNPGLLGAESSFASRYGNSPEALENLKDLIAPFLLRRLKKDVLKDLPAKTDITLKVQPSRQERLFYESVRLHAVHCLENSKTAGVIGIFAELMKLRRACCHPKLVDPTSKTPSSKLERFRELVTDLHHAGHKVLVFSQFVDHLKILRAEIEKLQLKFQYLDGSTPAKKRAQAVKTFQSGVSDVFLISLRAGGTGLNLTEANYVIHMDPWWNPATEDQASDRAHRLGQRRPVTVYRLILADTIEERILDLHGQKRELVDNLLQGSDRAGRLSAKELLGLLRETALT